jgi:integration host factor subunit alpha
MKAGASPMTLTKAHLIVTIAYQIGFPQNDSSGIFETLLELIKSTLEAGEAVLISGFGKFCVKDKRGWRDGIWRRVAI